MKYYVITLDLSSESDTTYTITAGSLSGTLRILSPLAWNEQFHNLQVNIQNTQKGMPLYNRNTKEIIKEYDYLSYIDSLSDTPWLDDIIPQQLLRVPEYRQEETMRVIVAQGKEFAIAYAEGLARTALSFLFTDSSSQQYSGKIRNQAEIREVNGKWNIQFLFDGDILELGGTLYLQIGVDE